MSLHRVRPTTVRHPSPVVTLPAPVVHVHLEPPAKTTKPPAHPLMGCGLLGCAGCLFMPLGCLLVTLLLTVSGWVFTYHPAFTALWH